MSLIKNSYRDQFIFPWWKIPLNNVTQLFLLQINWTKKDLFWYYSDRTKNHIISLLWPLSIDDTNIQNFLSNFYLDNDILHKIFLWLKESVLANSSIRSFSQQLTLINNSLYKYILNLNYEIIQKFLIDLLKKWDNLISEILQEDFFLEMLKKWDKTDIFWLNKNFKQKPLIYEKYKFYYENSVIIDLREKEQLILLL